MFWAVCVIFYRFDVSVSMAIALIFLILGLIFLVLGAKLPAEKTISLMYFYVGISVIESLYGIFFLKEKKLVSIKDLFDSFKQKLFLIK
jgi:hypothetical protein